MPLSKQSNLAAEKQAEFTQARRKYWDEYVSEYSRWDGLRAGYTKRLQQVFGFATPPGMRVLELGCGAGDLLAAMRPSYGVGIDFSPNAVSMAKSRHPSLRFILAEAHEFELNETFDYIIFSDLVNDAWDVQRLLQNVARHCHSGTKIIFSFYSHLWNFPRRMGELFGLAKPQLQQNWLTVDDVSNLLYLAGYDVVRHSHEVLCPFKIPLIAPLLNKFAVRLWPFSQAALSHVLIARLSPAIPSTPEPIVTVVVAARNEEGNVPDIFSRVPEIGGGTELIFVEGNSKDDTYGAIEREMAKYPGRNVKLFKQPGKGKGDAVRTGFAAATGEVLMILDADLTMPPEDLPLYYEAWRSGKAEFVNGVRLIYPMESKAMKFFNLIGNKFFSLAFSWLLNQTIKDTLCGTKVLSRKNYEMIAANRHYFGDFDPFGDFDLIFGAAKYNLKIVDLPIRYKDRVYGETNIQRWRHGVILLRMVVFAMNKIKFV